MKRKIEQAEMNIVRRIKALEEGVKEGVKEEKRPSSNATNHVDSQLSANAAEVRQLGRSSSPPSNNWDD